MLYNESIPNLRYAPEGLRRDCRQNIWMTTLGYSFPETDNPDTNDNLVYTDICTSPEDGFKKYYITFKKIPRDVFRV